jgi:hypothetical protein
MPERRKHDEDEEKEKPSRARKAEKEEPETVELPLYHPGFPGQPVLDQNRNPALVLTLKLPDGAEAKSLRDRVAARRHVPQGQTDPQSLELLLDYVVGWRGVTLRGRHVDYTPDNAREVFTKHPWMREQVEDFVRAALRS